MRSKEKILKVLVERMNEAMVKLEAANGDLEYENAKLIADSIIQNDEMEKVKKLDEALIEDFQKLGECGMWTADQLERALSENLRLRNKIVVLEHVRGVN